MYVKVIHAAQAVDGVVYRTDMFVSGSDTLAPEDELFHRLLLIRAVKEC